MTVELSDSQLKYQDTRLHEKLEGVQELPEQSAVVHHITLDETIVFERTMYDVRVTAVEADAVGPSTEMMTPEVAPPIMREHEDTSVMTPAETMRLPVETMTPDIELDDRLPIADLVAYASYDGYVQPVAQEAVAAEQAPLMSIADWAAELSLEPLDIYQDFTEALGVITQSWAIGEASQEHTADAVVEFEPQPAIITMLTERLTEADDEQKQLIAPVLKDIVGAVHGLQLLEARQADPEMIMAVTTKLEALCAELFTTLGIDYNAEDVQLFIATMRAPEFQLTQTVVTLEPELEYDGMREVKRHFPHLTDSLAGVEGRMQQSLGRAVLYLHGLRYAPVRV